MAGGRPGERLAPWVPRLRAKLGASAADEDVLLAAFYDDARLLAGLRDPVPECRARTTPLYELVRWLAERRDIERARIRFAGTEISLAA
jgi:oxaloacetate decarboxylase alpha subunit